MADETPAAPAEAPQAPESVADTSTNSNPTPAPEAPDMHGFTSEDLAGMRTFIDNNGGWDKIKSRISNPTPTPEQPKEQQPEQPQQQVEPQQPQEPAQPPKGYASLQELSVERYFKDLAADPKYANISEQIANGEVLKEMSKMGMNPIDSNYNINIDQLNQFLALKSASVPSKPTSVEPTTTPTVDYIPMDGEEITSMNQAIDIARQSTQLRAQGLPAHPAEAKALEYLKNNKFGQ